MIDFTHSGRPEEPISADQIVPEDVDWLWAFGDSGDEGGRIPRKMITVVGGRPEQGKGLFWAYLAAMISHMRFKTADGKARWGRSLISASEDSRSVMTRPRLEAAGAQLENCDLFRLRLPAMFEHLEAKLRTAREQGRPYDLLVMDPVASHLSGNVSRYSDNIRQVTDPLSEMLEAYDCACVMIEHVLKRVPQSGFARDAIGGSGSGLLAAARMAFLLGTDPADSDRRLLCAVKNNICEKPREIAFMVDAIEMKLGPRRRRAPVPALVIDSEVDFNPMDFLSVKSDRGVGRPADKRADVNEWLTNYMANAYRAGMKKVLASAVFEDAKQVGIREKMLKGSRRDMGIVLDPPGGGRGCKWELPDELIDALGLKMEMPKPSGDPSIEGIEGIPTMSEADFQALLGATGSEPADESDDDSDADGEKEKS